jgi:predicted phosphodiesterase
VKLAWSTDLHINHADRENVERYLEKVRSFSPDALVLTGDTAESYNFVSSLEMLKSELKIPIYFVLGNHDYYRGSAEHTVASAVAAHRGKIATYLPKVGVVSFSKTTALVGVGGWGDGRVGEYMSRNVELYDWSLIDDFDDINGGWDIGARRELLQSLADEEAKKFRASLRSALGSHKHVFAAMHVPPFHGAAWYQGKLSDRYWAPWFVCKAVGDVLLEAAEEFPKKAITVICGHTHSPGVYKPRKNLIVNTGGARYGSPDLADVIKID